MKALHEYETPMTDAETTVDEMGCPSVSALLACDLERKLAMCRDYLRIIRYTNEGSPVLTYQRMEELADYALDKTK